MSGRRTKLLLHRKTRRADALENGSRAENTGHECVLKRRGSAVALYLCLHGAVPAVCGVEGQQWEHGAGETDAHTHHASRTACDVGLGVNSSHEFTLVDGVLGGGELSGAGLGCISGAPQRGESRLVNAARNIVQQLVHALQTAAADLVDADKAHSSTASNSTRSIPISQTEDAI